MYIVTSPVCNVRVATEIVLEKGHLISLNNYCFPGEWAFISGHSLVKGEGGGECLPALLPLSSEHLQYYQMLFTVIAGPSNDLFKVITYLKYYGRFVFLYVHLYTVIL